jgi:hypothetical protein
MSRYYGIEFVVDRSEMTDDEYEAILSVIREIWPIDNNGYGEDTLCGGKSPEDLIAVVARALMKTLDKKIKFTTIVTYIEQAPVDTFTVDENYYRRLKCKSKGD